MHTIRRSSLIRFIPEHFCSLWLHFLPGHQLLYRWIVINSLSVEEVEVVKNRSLTVAVLIRCGASQSVTSQGFTNSSEYFHQTQRLLINQSQDQKSFTLFRSSVCPSCSLCVTEWVSISSSQSSSLRRKFSKSSSSSQLWKRKREKKIDDH